MSDNSNSNHNLLSSLLSVVDPFQVFRHHETDPNKRSGKPRRLKFTTSRSLEALIFLICFFGFFGFLAYKMTLPHLLSSAFFRASSNWATSVTWKPLSP